MKRNPRTIVLLAALALAAGLLFLPEQDPTPPQGKAAASPPPPPVVQPAVAATPPAEPPVVANPAALVVPPRAPLVVRDEPKQVPALENSQAVTKGLIGPPELVPAATVSAPEAKPVDEQPNSLFGWGPWAAGGQPAPTAGPAVPPGDGVLGIQAPTPTTSAPPPVVTPPPVVVPPPATGGSILGGHGWGDKNHVHIHRRDR